MKKALIMFLMLMLILQVGCSGTNAKGKSGDLSTVASEEIDVSKYSYKDYYKNVLKVTNALDDKVYVTNGCAVLDENFKLKSITNNAIVLDEKEQNSENGNFSEGIIQLDKSGLNFLKIQNTEYSNYLETNPGMSLKQYTSIFDRLNLNSVMAKYKTGEPYEYYITYGQDYNASDLTSGKINIDYLKIAENGSVSEYTPNHINESGLSIDDNDYFFITPYYLFNTDCSYEQGGSLPNGIGAVNKHWYDESTNNYVWEDANNIICVCFDKNFEK